MLGTRAVEVVDRQYDGVTLSAALAFTTVGC
jgi:hypothetical protein